MNNSRTFRQINEFEKKIISKSLFTISPHFLQFLIRSKNYLYISYFRSKMEIIYPKIYLISNDLKKEIEKIKVKDNIHSASLYFGFIKKGNFYLSLEGAEFLYNKGIFTEITCIYLNKKGEKSILYGNNIIRNMIINTPSNLKKGELLLVFNELKEILAIAQSKVDSKKIEYLKPKDVIAINLSDKGVYLREKQ